MARAQIGARRARHEADVDAVRHDRDVVRLHAELGGELTSRELAADHQVVHALHDAALEHPIERTRVEVVVVGDHGRVETVATARPERGGPDEAQRVDAQHVEARGPMHPRDGGWHHEGRDPPAQPAADAEAVDGPVRHIRRMRLAAREDQVDRHTGPPEAREDFSLVGLPARDGLGRHAAVGRADAHQGFRVATMR